MQIDLGQMSAADLSLDLPPDPDVAGSVAKDLTVSNVEALRGLFTTTGPSGWQLPNLTAVRLLLAKLHWKFGGLSLVSEDDAALLELRAHVVSEPDKDLDLMLQLGGLDAERLQLATASLRLVAQVEARGLRVDSRAGVGLLTAERATFHAFELHMGPLSLTSPQLGLTQLVVDWSGDDFRMEVGTAECAALTLVREGVALTGSAVSVAAVRLLGSQVRVGQLRAARLDVRADLAAPPAAAEQAAQELAADLPAPVERAAPSFDYALLNALSGRLDVDVDVDVGIPIIGHRHAVHPLRIPIDRGALNYRELEHNLARLEDSLIDFSVRDGALVLERGLPLISTRGRGKPILIWDLSSEDLALAEQQRVRLAVLPKFRMAGATPSDPPPPPEPNKEGNGGGAIKLRSLSFENVDAALRLLNGPSGADGVLRDLTFANLTVRGTVHHDPDGPARSGSLELTLDSLRTSLGIFPLGDQQLTGRVELASLRDAHVVFEDVRPVRAKALLEGFALAELELK